MFNNIERAKQLISFEDMQYGLCKPTDLDLVMDFRGKTFIYAELKLEGAPLTKGQRIYLSNVVRSHFDSGRHAVAIFAQHNQHDCDRHVLAKDAKVVEAYGCDLKWVNVEPSNYTLDEYIRKVYEYHLERNQLQY